MSAANERIGNRVREMRGDMSQLALAGLMEALGHKWSQSTVWSVEQGVRPLRLAEADDLASLLSVSIEELATGQVSDAAKADRRAALLAGGISRAIAELADSLERESGL